MHLRGITFLLLILAPLLAACAGGDGGPTIVLYKDKDRATAAPQEDAVASRQVSEPERGEEGGYLVQSGDNLYLIARRHGVPIRSLIEANGLVPPYRLSVGQRLAIPRSTTHLVKQGETINGIASLHEVSARELVQLNRLGPPYTVTPGQTLYLPVPRNAARPVQVAARPAAPAPNARTATAVPKPATGGIETQELEPLPPATAPAPPQPAAIPAPPEPPAPSTAPPTQVATKTVGPRPLRRPVPAHSGTIPQPPARSGSFLWPVRGRVISGFGPKAKGLHNDGINIAAPRGTPIKAAEHGVVAYSGSELRGYGNLVLIRHADGYMTAYGHTADLLVKRGQTVRRGQTIAKVGTSGAVSSPQLHFEIRKKKQALDPQRYLGG